VTHDATRREVVLSSLSLFEKLRRDEVARIAQRFESVLLAPGEVLACGGGDVPRRMVVVIHGLATVTVATGSGSLTSTLEPGDRFGTMPLLTGSTHEASLRAERDTEVAMLDKPGLTALLAEFPFIALPLAMEAASELRAKDEILRELLEVHAAKLSKDQRKAAFDARRRTIAARGARVARLSPRALFRSLVAERGDEPPFWMLTGFIVSMGVARLVVAFILKFKLEKQLFALVPGHDPNPMHVHHFNYGLILIGASGLAALFPVGRRALRPLAFAFGVGCGLVFDEFALFWNLNPEYAQSLSLIAAAMMVAVLLQLTYFGRFWAAIVRRLFYAARGAR
jgi:CRP-like cAMP-binding protein